MRAAARRAKAIFYGIVLLTTIPASSAEDAARATPRPADGRTLVFIELTEAASAHEFARVLEADGTRAHAPQVIHLADAAARAQLQKVLAQQARFAHALQSKKIAVTEIYRVQRALNGVAVQVEGAAIAAIRALSDVKRIRPLVLKTPDSVPSSNAVPFMQIPVVWQLPAGAGHADGTGVRIGIIDTGIDYIHADFGGSGLLSDYQANSTTTAPTVAYPSAKVAGGWDFAGDAYIGNNTPVPDPNPMDCNGHGSHVAGIAAGFGVTSAGTTFAGPYDGTVPFPSLRIHPGVAPEATLYALRVFGCRGATGLVAQAIDWALDPNNDGNLSDHLDVVNLSLGSNFGTVDSDPDLVAIDNAAAAGMSAVIAAGNSGNVYFISGALGGADRATHVAAADDNGFTAGGYRINSPPAMAGPYVDTTAISYGGVPPAGGLSGNVVLAHDGVGTDTDGCTAFTNAAEVAGSIAIFDRDISVCGNDVQAKNAQNAGAIAAIQIYDNDSLTAIAGSDTSVGIPYIRVTHSDGQAIKTNLAAGVNVTLFPGGDQIAAFSSRGPRGGRIGRLKPDLAAPGVNITSAQTGNTCLSSSAGCLTPNATGYIPGSQLLVISGTSMACPQIAGMTALVRQIHPDWSPEEVKAALINASSHPITQNAAGVPPVAPLQRAGAGRPDAASAAQSAVVAFNGDNTGTVSLSWTDEDFSAPSVRTKHVVVENKGLSEATFDVAIISATDAPGLGFSLPGGSMVTVPANGSATLDVQMTVDPAQMEHTREATMPGTETVTGTMASLGTLSKQFITEASAAVVFSVAGVEKMRVPLYATARPASRMSGSSPATGAGATGSGSITLSGTPVCTGTLAGTCSGSFPTDEVSLVSPVELQIVSPRNPAIAPPSADIQYAGAAYDAVNNVLMFGVSTYGDWGSPSETTFDVYIDTNNDGVWDYILFNGSAGRIGQYAFNDATSYSDAFINVTWQLSNNYVRWFGPPTYSGTYTNGNPADSDNALDRNNTAVLTVAPALLQISGTPGPFHYKVVTCPGNASLCQSFHGFQFDDENNGGNGYLFDPGNQGLNFGGAKLVQDVPGATLPVTWNTTNISNDGTVGALLLHHHNERGRRAEVIPLNGEATADVAVSATVTPANAISGQNVTLTVTATNNGPADATNVALWIPVPMRTSWASDDSGGAYDHNMGMWTAGSLLNGASATVHIVLTLAGAPPYRMLAQLSSSSPLDSNVANNIAELDYPTSADLALAAAASSPTVAAGAAITFTFTLTNNGPDGSANISVVNAFPGFPSTAYTSVTASAGTFDAPTRTWTLPALANRATATLQLTVDAPATAGTFTSSATVTADTADPAVSNNTASASTTVTTGTPPPAPANVVATAASTSEVDVSWLAATGATSYDVYRRDPGGTFQVVRNTASLTFADTTVAGGTAYLYKVQAVNAGGNSADSNVDLAMTTMFTDDPLVAGTTHIRAVHVTELRTTVNAVRALAGLTASTFTDDPLSATTVAKSLHIQELRTALDEARSTLLLPAVVYANPAAVGDVIRAADFVEIRDGMK